MGVKERKARQKESARQEILDAARALFVEYGFEATSIRRIADKAEYAPGTIYLYFRDKYELLAALCEETFSKLARKMSAIKEDDGDTLGAIRRAGRLYVQFGLDHPQHYILTFMTPVENADAMKNHADAGSRCFSQFHALVERAIREDLLNCDDADEVAQSLWAGIHGVTALLITKCEFPFIEQTRLIERVLDVLIEGIRKR